MKTHPTAVTISVIVHQQDIKVMFSLLHDMREHDITVSVTQKWNISEHTFCNSKAIAKSKWCKLPVAIKPDV